MKASGPAVFAKYASKGQSYHWGEASGSLRRHNAFTHARYIRVLRAIGPLAGEHVLDVGCGDGVLSAMVARSGARVVGVDYVLRALRTARDCTRPLPAAFAAASACALPFAADSFDVVIAAEIIEHLRRPGELVAEMHRVLGPGGRVVVTTPYRLSEHPCDAEHVSEFYPDELTACLGAFFTDVTVQLSHPVWLTEIYLQPTGGRRWMRALVNLLAVYLGYNPFLTDRRFRYYAQIVATGVRP
jgi:2-polyprenyl-3-methyl-5-hydroxy-6-metoxy-1,4-benzoquinol methylase